MAKIKGCNGIILLTGSDTNFGELRTWEYETDASQEDVSVMGDCDPAYADGPIITTGRCTFFYNIPAGTDPAPDAGQANLVAGTSVLMKLRPNGTGSGKPELEATVFITNVGANAEFAGRVQGSMAFQFGGLWDETAQS